MPLGRFIPPAWSGWRGCRSATFFAEICPMPCGMKWPTGPGSGSFKKINANFGYKLLHFFVGLYILSLAGGSTTHWIACRTRLRISKTRGIAMKRKGILALLIVLALGTGLTLLNRCSGGDMATVTIEFGENLKSSNVYYKSKWRIFLNTLLPDAFAKGDPWNPTHTSVIITVTGPGMSNIVASVPPYTSSHTLEIPAGTERRITVIAYNGSVRKTGGHTIVDLNAGDNLTAQIQLLPILPIVNSPYGSGSLAWDYVQNIAGITVNQYYLYESETINGSYVHVHSYPYYTHECSSCGTAGYYYKVSAVYDIHGEGELSDPYLMP